MRDTGFRGGPLNETTDFYWCALLLLLDHSTSPPSVLGLHRTSLNEYDRLPPEVRQRHVLLVKTLGRSYSEAEQEAKTWAAREHPWTSRLPYYGTLEKS